MQARVWATAAGMVALAAWLAPTTAAEAPCADTRDEASGILKWLVGGVVVSASTAIAARTVDHEVVDDACVPLGAVCEAVAADRSDLVVRPAAFEARFKRLVGVEGTTVSCSGVERFEGTNGVVRVLFEA